MKYESVNELDFFNFHDSELTKIEFQKESMIWKIENANVTIENSQNKNSNDMCVSKMKITFENVDIGTIRWLEGETRDSNGNLIKKTQIPNEKNIEILKESLNSYCYILGCHQLESKSKYLFTMNLEKGILEIIIKFKNVIAEWNTYNDVAWYVKNKCNN